MAPDQVDDIERSTTRRTILKVGLVASTMGIGGTATGLAQTDAASEGDTETHTVTATLVESGDAGIISGDVTVDGQTKTTTPVDGSPHRIQTTFELENGTYTVSATSEYQDETWRAKDQEVTIDGSDKSISLTLYPPGSDELEDAPNSEETTGGSGDDSDGTDGENADDADETDSTDDQQGSSSAKKSETGCLKDQDDI